MIKALAASGAGNKLEPFEFEFSPLEPDQVEIDVQACGICHSDLSMLDNAWDMTEYPFVPGHEVVGSVAALGDGVSHLKVGQTVGLGWFAGSCMHCPQCLSGHHNLCVNEPEQTIVGRYGGFAQKVRCHWSCAIPLPDGLDPRKVGPLFCGGITVFNPIVQFDVRPTDRVGVIGIGGLGHLAVRFLNKWGCEVTAFSSTAAKKDEVMAMGAHRVVNSRDAGALEAVAGQFDFIISTVNQPLEWGAYLAALAPAGRLHVVGAVLEPMPVEAFSLIMGQKSMSGSPVGSPGTIGQMLDFCARHEIEPVCEFFPMSRANEAFDHLRAGKARYRIVLENDLG